MVQRRQFLKNGMLATAAAACSLQVGGEPHSTEGTHIALKRHIPVRYEADVVVVGGGISGVAAACSAAATGARVILIEQFGALGGALTTGGVANFCGQIEAQGEVFDEILRELRRFNALGEGSKNSVFNYEIMTLVLQEILLARKVKLLLHTRLVDVMVKGSRLSECIICGKSGLEGVRGKIFIDCSGEADLARYAGLATLKGDPVSGYQLPMSKIFFVREVDNADVVQQVPSDWPTSIKRMEDLPMTSLWPDGPRGKAIKVKIPMFDATQTEGLTLAEIQARRRTMDVLAYYQNVEHQNWRLTHSATQIGIREGCRIVGDYILTVDDLRAGRTFEDGVARGTYYLDGHGLADDKRTYILPPDKLKVPPYQIPLRSLIAKEAENVMMAGRCMSAEQLALSSARVSTSCAMMGQAVGITAALALQHKTTIRNIAVDEVKKELVARGAQLDVSRQLYPIYG